MFPFVRRVSCVLLAGLPAQSAQPQIPSQRLSGVTPSPVLRHLGRQPRLQPRGVGQLIQGVWTPGRCVPGKWPLQTADHTPSTSRDRGGPLQRKSPDVVKNKSVQRSKCRGSSSSRLFKLAKDAKREISFFFFIIFCFFILSGFFSPLVMHL